MSHLLIITRPAFVAGFRLAGVNAFGAVDVEAAEELIEAWLAAGETGLLAIDEGILERMDPAVVKKLDATQQLPYLAIPGGKPLGPEASRQVRLAGMIRRTIGYHITFKGEELEVEA
ncbi:MAG: V-type ATP synthase subunit F [Anaerolineae bacterium]|nr:V-type ATP synthase subunit F [Anaerolineae bacterium]